MQLMQLIYNEFYSAQDRQRSQLIAAGNTAFKFVTPGTIRVLRAQKSSSLQGPTSLVTPGTNFVTPGTSISSLRGLLFVTPGTALFVTSGTQMDFQPFQYAGLQNANTRARINPLTLNL